MSKLFIQAFVSMIMIVFTVLITLTLSMAQEYKMTLTHPEEERLILRDFIGELWVEGYDGKEIVVKRSFENGKINSSFAQNIEVKEQDKPGMGNPTNVGLHLERKGHLILLSCIVPTQPAYQYRVKIPKNLSIKIEGDCDRLNEVTISDMMNETDITSCRSVQLSKVSGSILVSVKNGNIVLENCELNKGSTVSLVTLSGDVLAHFAKIQDRGLVLLNTISGNVSLSLPPNSIFNSSLRSTSGIIRSDFIFPEESITTNQVIGTKIDYRNLAGATEIKITTVSGNININNKIFKPFKF
jgi:hypothetical protein